MYDVFLDTEYEDKGGKIFLVGILSTHGETYSLYDGNLRWNVLQKILKNKRYIFVYGPDIGKLEKHFGVKIKENWHCINVLSIVRKFLPELPSKSLINVEKLLSLERQTTAFKKYTRFLDTHWKNPRKRSGIIQYNLEDIVFMQVCYDILYSYFRFNPDDFRMKP